MIDNRDQQSMSTCPHVTRDIRRATSYGILQENCRGTRTHTLREPAQSKCMSTCRKSHQRSHCINFTRKYTGKLPRPRLRTHTLCEPAQSKRMSTLYKSHFMWKFAGKMPQTKMRPERGHTFCASQRSRKACPHVTRVIRRATFYRNFQENCHSLDWAQNADTHTLQSKRVSTYHKRRQKSEDPLYTAI